MLRLAVFLGNPGEQHRRNRHNAGRLLAEKLPFYKDLGWQKKFKGLFASASFAALAEGEAVEMLLLRPETFMNLSGESVRAAAAFYRLAASSVIVVHDELELPLGTAGFKYGGGLGGHNGLRSIKECLGTADFWRLRVGIDRPAGRRPGEGGPPGSGGDVYGWVLSNFSASQLPALDETLAAAAKALLRAFAGTPEQLLPEWKKKRLPVLRDAESQ